MKFAYWVILALVIFNFMILMVDNLEVFNISYYTAEETEGLEDYESLTGNETGIIKHGMGISSADGISLSAIALSIAVVGVAGGLAWVCRSPVPLGVGAFAALFTGIWAQTYGVLSTQFGIPHYLLLAGTIGLGIMVVITAIEMMTGGHTT